MRGRLRQRVRPAWPRFGRLRPIATGAATLAACAGADRLWGPALRDWVVGLGMDGERAALIASLLVAGGAALLASALAGIVGARAGAALGFLAIGLGPFLWRAAHLETTPGLQASRDLQGWVLQPLGMLLLAAVAVIAGAAIGDRVRVDVRTLWRSLRRSRWRWVPVAVVAAAIPFAGAAAANALQNGPIGSLYSYRDPQPARAAGPVGARETVQASGTRSRIDHMTVGGRSVLVYLPAAYAADQQRRFAVVYLLHGFPGTVDQWLGSGAQVQGVLDQVIAAGTVPPLIAVMPDGNGSVSADSEWGDTARGDRVEDWLVRDVVPALDAGYRTRGAEFRGIAGLSSGGFGALNLAIRHPSTFRWAASYSGFLLARQDIFGAAWRANSPLLTAPSVPPAMRMPLFVVTGSDEQNYLGGAQRFATQLGGLGWTVDVEVVPGGHGWETWRAEMVRSFMQLGQLWGSPTSASPAGVPGPRHGN